MIVDHEELMRWAKEQAPIWGNDVLGYCNKRPVRLEIAADEVTVLNAGFGPDYKFIKTGVVACVYLRDPRCVGYGHSFHSYAYKHKSEESCECGPIAKKRLA